MTKPKIFCFDLDGTLCTNTHGDYESAEPFPWAIRRVNALADAGHKIIIFTARGATTGIDWTEVTAGQLARWGVRYDELRLGKPGADVYVDDRAVHADAWRFGHLLGLTAPAGDGSARQVFSSGPAPPPPRSRTLVETGRTFGGRPFRVDEHASRLLGAASAAGMATFRTAEEITAAVDDSVGGGGVAPAPGGDVVFTIALSDVPTAAFADTIDPEVDPALTVSCRLLAEAAEPLSHMALPDSQGALRASTSGIDGYPSAWPLWKDASGALVDLLGGQVATVAGGAVTIAAPLDGRPTVAASYLAQLASEHGIDAQEGSVTGFDEVDEAFIVGLPFCIVPLGEVDGVAIGSGTTGETTVALRDAWSSDVGVELAAQIEARH